MTAQGFRRIALGMARVVEGAHMGHADFRVGARIFATLGYPDARWGMVALSPEQQAQVMAGHAAFAPAAGAWGAKGATVVRLAAVDQETLGAALTQAWQTATARSGARRAAPRARPRRGR